MIKKNNIHPYNTEFLKDSLVKFIFWAPDAKDVKLCLKIGDLLQELPMVKDKDNLFTITTKATNGTLYGYKIDGSLIVPDPASRFQPEDVHGLSQLINPENFDWEEDSAWPGKPWEEVILYELHVGTFTPKGTFKAIEEKLDYFVELGVNAIELMPVADFAGKRNWGYDGVLIYAPDSSYGTPDELKNLIKTAHKKGLMVFLDVVYNHFGPDGNYLHTYAKSKFFDEKITTPWGSAINFQEKYVRNFFINNAIYWFKEYHFDGLRIDAIHAIYDDSSPDIIEELASRVNLSFNLEPQSKQDLNLQSRLGLPAQQQGTDNVLIAARHNKTRHIHLVLENDDNESRYLGELNEGKYAAQWNDDFHHCIHILTTGETSGYYVDYINPNSPSSYLAKALTEGFSYQGEKSVFRNNTNRGEKSTHLSLSKFVNFIQNHDQIGNRAFGERLSILSNDNLIKAAACLYLLAPSIPLLFMGEEWGSKSSFYFFCNFNDELADAIKIGRREEFARFPEFSNPEIREKIPDPSLEKTFLDSKLNWEDLDAKNHREMFEFYQKMLSIRKEKIIPSISNIKNRSYEIYTDKAFCANWQIGEDNKTLCVLANFGNTSIDASSCIKEDIIAVSNPEATNELVNDKTLPAQSVVWYLN